ncbi:hypothetical protein [Cytobacillus firmus]|uniref:hypothetical protein n=1 Tax=Cytobacillus firmus TaxID=1399 RepID=UPI001C95A69A|nr:hypothetical protein [Cytobacillus firmus]MBY6053265.1 hypothetical protein [Cytobacillus firmus]
MTAEIAIMNRQGIALAADSATSTILGTGFKVYNSANKLFALSKIHPVGIMVYGNSAFMNIPWETLIKVFRENLGTKKYDLLEGYATEFINFLAHNQSLSSLSAEKELLQGLIYKHLNTLFERANKTMHKKFTSSIPTNAERLEVLQGELDKYFEVVNALENYNNMPNYSRDDFMERFNDAVIMVVDELIGLDNITEVLKESILELSFLLSYKNLFEYDNDHAGIVIAGFGENEIFPSVFTYNIDGIIQGGLRYELAGNSTVGFTSSRDETTGAIIPFAQQEMVHSFVEGIHPNLKELIQNSIKDILDKYPALLKESLEGENHSFPKEYVDKMFEINASILSAFEIEMEEAITEGYVHPLLETLEILPKEELASMAKALVNLTSLKRKVTLDAETVGGPIDVAVITKGDGFIWMERKHYFQPELNNQFFQNYFRSDYFDTNKTVSRPRNL